MKKRLFPIVILLALPAGLLFSQAHVVVGDTTGSASHLYGPIHRASASSNLDYSIYGYLFDASELGLPNGTKITSISWKKQNANTMTGFFFHVIRFKESMRTAWGTTERYDSLTSPSFDQVLFDHDGSINDTANAWVEFRIPRSYTYKGGNLMVTFYYARNSSTGPGPIDWYYEPASGKAVGGVYSTPPGADSLTSPTYSNNRPATRFTVQYPPAVCPVFDPPVLENFPFVLPYCWDIGDGGSPASGPGTLGSGAWGLDYFANTGSNLANRVRLWDTGDSAWLILPNYNLDTLGPHQLEFDFGVFSHLGSSPATLGSDDQVQLLVSTDSGATWNTLATYDNSYVTGSGGNHEVIDLTAYHQQIVQFAFWATEGVVDNPEDNDVFMDNFQVRNIPPSCPAPSGLFTFANTDSSANLSWTSGGAANWNIEYGPIGFSLGTGTPLQVTNDTIVIGGLGPASCYEFYVQDSCGIGDVSTWTGPQGFCTLCYNSAGLDSIGAVCASNTMVDLSSYLRMAGIGGNWWDEDTTGALNGAVFDASQVAAGNTYHFSYILPTGICLADTARITLQVDPAFTAGLDSTGTVCASNMTVNLNTFLRMAVAGGNWLDDDATGAITGSIFDASQVNGGTGYNFTYFVTGGSCPNDSATVTLNVEALPNAGADASDTICDTAVTVDLFAYLDTGITMGGTWLDLNNSGGLSGSIFDPGAVANNTSYTFRYLLNGLSCPDDSATLNLYVENCSIGLSEYELSGIELYPNPARNILYVEDKHKNSQRLDVDIFTMNGRLLCSYDFTNTGKQEVDISGMAAGLYLVQVSSEKGTKVFKVLMQ